MGHFTGVSAAKSSEVLYGKLQASARCSRHDRLALRRPDQDVTGPHGIGRIDIIIQYV
jgi:hypothetical protein